MSKRELLARTLERTGLGSLLSRTVGRWNGLVVFNYHRIGDPAQAQFDRALYSADQEDFDRQVRFLKQNYDVVRVDDLEQALRRPGRSVMITFDDGYRDNFDFALPVLTQHRVPATFFITSGFIDRALVAWWDEIAWMVRSSSKSKLPSLTPAIEYPLGSAEEKEGTIKAILRFYKNLSDTQTAEFMNQLAEATGSGRCPASLARELWMNWDMIREMDRSGMDLGGHTVNHPVLANTDAQTQRAEILGSKQRIEAEIGHPITAFSYPVGQPTSFTAETKQILSEAGYRWAFSFSGGFGSTGHSDHFDLPRVAVSPHISRELFQSTARLPWLFA
ncbi:polysaccharide deacetylase family protein [Planctomicrobium sp. SH661]|uniref:polysaccharide deacetylase family protein n=1 Tax=Planctomicrobium sp. SH661 TaxID=3448124 RepID=UPI003F5CB249